MSDQNAFSIPSDEQVLEAGSRVRKVTVNMIDMFEFEAESLADAISGTDYIKRVLSLQATREKQELTEEEGDHVGPHGPGCECDVLLERLFGSGIPNGDTLSAKLDEIIKRAKAQRKKGN